HVSVELETRKSGLAMGNDELDSGWPISLTRISTADSSSCSKISSQICIFLQNREADMLTVQQKSTGYGKYIGYGLFAFGFLIIGLTAGEVVYFKEVKKDTHRKASH
ncbi:hypothetical protein ACFL27_24315, partial [candidate division CSSED10-310 bacterium]